MWELDMSGSSTREEKKRLINEFPFPFSIHICNAQKRSNIYNKPIQSNLPIHHTHPSFFSISPPQAVGFGTGPTVGAGSVSHKVGLKVRVGSVAVMMGPMVALGQPVVYVSV
jgi:hypothetical protein